MKCELCKLDISGKPKRFCSQSCQKKAWSLANKDRHLGKIKEWGLNNPDNRKETRRKHRQNNSEYYAEYESLRKRLMLQARPKWANRSELRKIYKEAKTLEVTVDHIIPLKHPKVCGLHVPNNLQLLTRSENSSKNNTFRED